MATKAKGNQLDLELIPGPGEFTGTFRWSKKKKLNSLPPFPSCSVKLDKSWTGYFQTRSPKQIDLSAIAKADPSLVDGLSFPMTVLHTLSAVAKMYPNFLEGDSLHVVVLGASEKAEERILRETCYWQELSQFYSNKKICITLCGPEISGDAIPFLPSIKCPGNFQCNLFKGTFLSMIEKIQQNHGGLSASSLLNAVFFTFNGGFGNFMESKNLKLLWSWLNDLYALTALHLPAFFTCANDYADVTGEFKVMDKLIGALFLMLPTANPFQMATTLADTDDSSKWSRGNSFWYAVQGYDPNRRHVLDLTQQDRQRQMAVAFQVPDTPEASLMVPLSPKTPKGETTSTGRIEESNSCKSLPTPTTLDMNNCLVCFVGQSEAIPTHMQTPHYEKMLFADAVHINIYTPLLLDAQQASLVVHKNCFEFLANGVYYLHGHFEVELEHSISQAIFNKTKRRIKVKIPLKINLMSVENF